MIKTLIESIKLNNTYNVNRIIYFLKNTIIGNKSTANLYSNKSLKILGLILNAIKSLFSLFIVKSFSDFLCLCIYNYEIL